MSFGHALTAELRREADTTRKFLERFPEDRADYQPHPKSMTVAALACHVIELPEWSFNILRDPGFDFATWKYQPLGLRTRAELLAKHEDVTDRVVQLASGVDDAVAADIWKLSQGEQVLNELPRAVAIRGFVTSHLIHHRGQLSVYYRLLDVPVPGAYGPSADDRAG